MSDLKLTPERIEQFLAHVREVPNLARAARLIGVARQTINSHKAKHPDFKAQVDEALQESLERCEEEVHRRAFTGVDRPLTHQGHFTYERDFFAIDPETGERYPPHLAPIKRDEHGNPVIATIKEYSDTLAMFYLKAHLPEKYRERQDVAITNPDGSLSMSESEKAARLSALLAIAQSRKDNPGDDGSDLV